MAECRRCQAEISEADIQKGRALQRGEFFYCPTCVAEARAAKGGGSSASPSRASAAPVSRAAAPASKVAAGAPRAAASGTRPAPGNLKAAPPSSGRMKPAPAPAAAPPPPSSKRDKFADLIDEDAPAESEAPGKAAGRGPASSRLQKAPAPASTRSRRGAPPPPEEEHTGASSPGRRKIGFKEGGATIGTPMSKQSFMMWVVGGGAMFLIAIGLFSTLIIGRMKEKKAAEKQAVLAKASEQTLDRIYREDPNNLQAINEALKEFEESAKGTKMVGMIEEWQKKVAVRHTDVRLKKEANEELSVISGLLAQPGGGEAARRRLTKVVKSVAAVAWFGEEKRTYDSTLLSILRSSQGYAEKGESAEPKNWDEIAGHWLVVDFLGKAVPPDLYPAADAQAVRRKIDEAVEKRYEDPAFLDRLQWQDLTGSDWKNDDALSVARSPEGVTLSYNGSDPAGLYWLNQVVTWQDYIVQVEFTTDNGFQVLQRTLPGQPAGATHDFDAAIQTNFVKPNERTTSNLWVYMSRFRTQIGDTKGRPAICPPSAPRTGGITIRVPKGTKVTIHKISVKVLASEETEAGPPK